MKRYCLAFLLILQVGSISAQTIRIRSFQTTDDSRDSTYNLGKTIVLYYREMHLLIGLRDESDPQAQYACRLLGLERKWRPNGRGESITYANLFGGDYEFQVRNERYPNRVASLKFRLEEAFWQKGWFMPMLVAYGLLVLGVIMYFFRLYRLRSQIRLEKIRNEIAADLHDDVGSTLGNISFLTELAKMKYARNPDDVLPILEKILTDSQEMIQTLRGMVWTINPDNDRAVDFVEKIRAFADSMLGSRHIELRFKNELGPDRTLSIEQQRNLFLVLKELVHNCAKHSGATQVILIFKEHQNCLWMKMTDSGQGFDPSRAAEGNGLRNLQQRVTAMEGKLELESAEGKGVIVKLMVPF